MKRPAVLALGTHREAASGVATHLNVLFASRLADEICRLYWEMFAAGRVKALTRP